MYAKPDDFAFFEIHVSYFSGFIPTGWDAVSQTWSNTNAAKDWDGNLFTMNTQSVDTPVLIMGLIAGMVYVKIVAVDNLGNKSAPSVEFSANADSSQKTASFVVAASDSSPDMKAGADYVCDGDSDEVEINQALLALHTPDYPLNLLANGDFSKGDTTGWSAVGGSTLAVGPCADFYNPYPNSICVLVSNRTTIGAGISQSLSPSKFTSGVSYNLNFNTKVVTSGTVRAYVSIVDDNGSRNIELGTLPANNTWMTMGSGFTLTYTGTLKQITLNFVTNDTTNNFYLGRVYFYTGIWPTTYPSGKLILLDGTFLIKNTISVYLKQTLEGQGQKTIIKAASGFPNNTALITSAVENYNSGWTIRNLTLDGNASANSTISLTGINTSHSWNIIIDNVSITDFVRDINYPSTGIISASCVGYGSNSNNVTIRNCNIDTIRTGISLGGTYCNVIGNTITGCGSYGTGINVGGSGHLINNNIINNCTDANHATNAILLLNATNVMVSGNSIMENDTGIYAQSSSYCTISSNNLYKNTEFGINLYQANHNLFSGNNFKDNGSLGQAQLEVSGSGTGCDYNTIENNILRSVTGYPTISARGIDINGSTCDANVVSNNDCYQAGSSYGIYNSGTGTVFGSNRNNGGGWSTTPS